jgi:hypothetical protein
LSKQREKGQETCISANACQTRLSKEDKTAFCQPIIEPIPVGFDVSQKKTKEDQLELVYLITLTFSSVRYMRSQFINMRLKLPGFWMNTNGEEEEITCIKAKIFCTWANELCVTQRFIEFSILEKRWWMNKKR